MEASEFDCLKCGACCLLGLDVLLSEEEAERFEADPRLLPLTVLHPWPPTAPMRFLRKSADTGGCIALAGELGRCHCTIYADRPALCREFPSGAPDCLEARAKMGIPGGLSARPHP